MRPLLSVIASLVILASFIGCGDDPAAPESGGPNDKPILVDAGYIGLVLDTRPIFRWGYLPTEAQVTFADYPDHDAVLDIDPLTNAAFLIIANNDLSEAEQQAFQSGVAATIVIVGTGKVELARLESPGLVLDDSNQPISLETSLPRADPILSLRADMPYLLQLENKNGVMALTTCSDCYMDTPYLFGETYQHHFFTEVGAAGSGIYNIRNINDSFPGREHLFMEGSVNGYLGIRSTAAGGPEDFGLELDQEGFVRIRHMDSGLYLYQVSNGNIQLNETGDRFRLISDSIAWSIEDLGTRFNQPIMPPAQLDFAYTGRLSNCSSAILEETVGQSESRTTTTSIGTTEGLQLFSESSESYDVTYGTEIEAGVGFEIGGLGASSDISYSEEETWSQVFTTNQTNSTENTWAQETSRTIEVSRSRTVTVPEFTVVDVDDAVKTIRNVVIPFTQVLRVRGTDRVGDTPVSGAEISTQVAFNHATCLVTEVGLDYVLVSIRGEAQVDQIVNASTLVVEVVGGCE